MASHTDTSAGVFLDLDNVLTSMLKIDIRAAEAFISRPSQWLRRLERLDDDARISPVALRRAIVRRAYLNSSGYIQVPGERYERSISEFRPAFVNAGWEIRETPPLTRAGKSAADIHLALDAFELVLKAPHVTELLILSADADFTPLVMRARAHGRRVVVAHSGPAARAYVEMADLVIDAEQFTREVLGVVPQGLIIGAVNEMFAALCGGAFSLATLEQRVIAQLGADVVADNWAGWGSLQALLQQSDCHEFEVHRAPSGDWCIHRHALSLNAPASISHAA